MRAGGTVVALAFVLSAQPTSFKADERFLAREIGAEIREG
jgi:hypothetical protein